MRNVLLMGHRQAYVWMDEWYGMTIEDVRDYEIGMHTQTNQRMAEVLEVQQCKVLVEVMQHIQHKSTYLIYL